MTDRTSIVAIRRNSAENEVISGLVVRRAGLNGARFAFGNRKT